MNKIKIYLAIILAAGIFVSCDKDEDVSPTINEEQAVAKATSMISGGTVSHSSTDTTATGAIYYEVDITTAESAVIEFDYFQENGELKEIEGDSRPFDYEVNPGMGLKVFSQAKAAALAAQPGAVISWSLEKNINTKVWEYEFNIFNSSTQEDYTVYLNASTGEVIAR